MREQAIAGTADDRAALAAEAEESARVLQEHGQQLEEEIRTKQAALRLLQDSASQATKRVEQAREACQRLTQFLPPPIVDEINMIKKHSARSYKERLHFLETEISYRQQMMAGCPTDPQQADHWHNSLKQVHPELVRGRTNGDGQRGWGYELNPSVWAEVKARWQAEIAEWEPEVAELRESVEGAEKDIALLTQHYWR
jgi:DNA repair exonuclease SbcCD ATPase subunit